jgi:flavin reductase (DIM6/NTAB) family NADH-FMN oxidoreductase RutF
VTTTDQPDAGETFDRLMADIDQPMVIVTTGSGDARAGCLVGFHAQCGIEPPEYAVWLSKANHTYRVGALTDHFGVHFLSADDHDLAELFGGRSQEDTDKFASCAWSEGPHGVPLLDRVGNRFVGKRAAWLDPGADHVCLVLRPVSADRSPSPSWLRLADAADIEAGHGAEERQRPREGD